jgi:hypothetical protein
MDLSQFNELRQIHAVSAQPLRLLAQCFSDVGASVTAEC